MKYYLVRAMFFLLVVTAVSGADDTGYLVGPTKPVLIAEGDDVILPCTLNNPNGNNNAFDQTVEWSRLDLNPKEVHLYRNIRDENADQNTNYKGRTSLFRDDLENGIISLKLSRVKLADTGNYTCSVPPLKTVIQLIVGAVSQPVISVVGPKDYDVVLKCVATFWTFKPDLTWLDSDGSILTEGPTEIQIDSEGRYTVRGEVTVQKTDKNMFTCRVNQQQINQMKKTEYNVPDAVFPMSRGQKAGIIIGVIIAVTILSVAGGVYMWRQKKQLKQQQEEQKKQLKQQQEEQNIHNVNPHMAELIQRVTKVIPITDELLQKGLIQEEDCSNVLFADASKDQMIMLYQVLDYRGPKAKSAFYRILKEKEPDIIRDLDVDFVDQNKDLFIQRVNDVNSISDELLQKGLIKKEDEDKIRAAETSQDQMTQLYQVLSDSGPDS
ncbi:hypothetical protein UPYG_G00247030 [Umbra pygmaea]|uniref:Uncharacterized protein n=1 Tax=Umbra pygmaea TaxID=75934 RepID=A0ABD0X0M8_UMBPY